MNINRHNYEEYFILYLDNELNSDERNDVEIFIQSHPDLKEELELISQFKLVPDPSVVFYGKESLLKNTQPEAASTNTGSVNSTNYQEWFNLYIDNELSEDDRLNVQHFISLNPAFGNELFLLQKTKLEPEKIIFNDKASLYRTKEKIFVMSAYWWRVAAAAILILGIGFTSYKLINKKSINDNQTEIAKTHVEKDLTSPAQENLTSDKRLTTEENQKIKNVIPDQKRLANKINQSIPAVAAAKTNKLQDAGDTKVKSTVTKKEEPVFADNKPKNNNLPAPENNFILQSPDQNQSIALNKIKKENVNPITAVGENVTNKTPTPSNIVQASFKDDTIFDQDDKKNKFRGFFRKITRTLEKRTDIDVTNEDGKLLVAGLAFKLK